MLPVAAAAVVPGDGDGHVVVDVARLEVEGREAAGPALDLLEHAAGVEAVAGDGEGGHHRVELGPERHDRARRRWQAGHLRLRSRRRRG